MYVSYTNTCLFQCACVRVFALAQKPMHAWVVATAAAAQLFAIAIVFAAVVVAVMLFSKTPLAS